MENTVFSEPHPTPYSIQSPLPRLTTDCDLPGTSDDAGMGLGRHGFLVNSEQNTEGQDNLAYSADEISNHSNAAHPNRESGNDVPSEEKAGIGVPAAVHTAGPASGTHESTQPSYQVHCKTIAFCRLVVQHPKKAFGITLTINMSLVVITGILLAAGYDILPTNFSEVPMDLQQDEQYLRTQAWLYRDADLSIHSRFLTGSTLDERSVVCEEIIIMYDLQETKSNVFTAKHLRNMKIAEEELMALDDFHMYCLADMNLGCDKPRSILRFFDGSYSNVDPRLFDPDYENIAQTLAAAAENPTTSSILDFHLGRSYTLNSSLSIAYSDITRSVFKLALPISGFDNLEDNSYLQWQKINQFIMGPLRNKLYHLSGGGVGGMRFSFLGATLYKEDLVAQVVLDLALATGSVMFIFGFMWFQTGSLFVSLFGILSILTSFCGANLIYRVVFNFRYFGIFHVLSVFIILGIGADDIFVYFDTWRHTGFENYASIEERMSACYRRACMAMLVTSLTTMVAFLASALSPLLAVSSFGLFSALLVFVNYISVITFFPAVVYIYHTQWQQQRVPCSDECFCRSSRVKDRCCVDADTRRENPVVRFFSGPYVKFVTHRALRWVLLILFATLVSYLVYSATCLVPDEKGVQLFKSNSNFGRVKLHQASSFKPSLQDSVIQVYMVWGMKHQDKSSCSRNALDGCTGRTVWDDGFDMNPAPAQSALKDFCSRLRHVSDEENERLMIRRDPETGELQVKCFVERMEEYLQDVLHKPKYGFNGDFRLPTSAEEIKTLMSAHPDIYSNVSHLHETFYRYFEVALSYWLSNGYSGHLDHDFDVFSPLVGESSDKYDTTPIRDTGYRYGTRLRYAAIAINTSIPFGNIGYEQGIPIMNNWEEFFNIELNKMPPSLSGGFQCTPVDPPDSALTNNWHWLKVQKTLARTAVNGVVIGICLAAPVLILSTQNLVVGLLATFTIATTTVSVIGLIPLAGWKLGVLESLNVSLIVGLSVDYVVHLAEAYCLSTMQSRLARTRDMLRHAGVSVLSGAITTLGASLFMLFAKIRFFMQFGIFMFATIGFSLIFSLGLFALTMSLVGPEGSTGSLSPIVSYIRRVINGRKGNDVDCQRCSGKGFHPPQVD